MRGKYLEDLNVGDQAETRHTVTETDIRDFSAVSGDDNPLHLDEAFAATTAFKGRVAHGMLAGAYVSAILGTRLPGPGAIYVSQTMNFKRPVRIGDELTTRVVVAHVDDKRAKVTLSTVCLVGGKVAVDGEAVVIAPRRNGA
ncbi:MAG TPA: MaoC family dehydratase [Caulobacteraceae bacterium]